MEKEKQNIWFVYDGECPICQMGATLFKVKERVGTLHTVDARADLNHQVLKEINAAKLNLDEGMVIKYNNQLYQGRDALILMANIGDDKDIFNGINSSMFKSKILATLCYPSMKLARNIALGLKGVGRIDNLKGQGEI